MKKIILILLFTVLLTGCVHYKDSDIKEEQAEIIQLSYVPRTTSSVSGMSINMDGDIGLVGGSSTQEEIWAVVIRCDEHHQTFALKSKELYSRVKPGDIITLKYYETLIYDDKEPENTKVVDTHTKQIIFKNCDKIDR